MKNRIKEIFENSTGISSDKYNENSKFMDDLGLDSLDLIDVIMTCEKEFGIIIPDEAVVYMKTVGDLINYIEERCS